VLGHWRAVLDGAPELISLPTDRPRPRVQRFHGREIVRPVPEDAARALRSFAAANRVTPYTVGYAAFAVLLARYTRCTDLVIGVVVAGRGRPEFAETVGFFAEILPVRVDLSGDPVFREVLGTVRDALFAAYENDLLPFDVLVDRLGVRRDLSYTPLVQVIFQMRHPPPLGTETRWGDLRVRLWGEDVTHPASRFDLEAYLSEGHDDGLALNVCYNTDLFEEASVARIADDYLAVLAALCAHPEHPISRVPLRPAGATARVTIRDEHGVPLPPGVPGRLWLRATGSAEEVATGLLARVRADGALDTLGVAGDELVVRGCRVPAGVIEAALLEDPAVAAAQVTTGEDGEPAARLTPAPPPAVRPSDDALCARLRRLLPAFLVPAAFTWTAPADAGAPPDPDAPSWTHDPAAPPVDDPMIFIVSAASLPEVP
jgi:non-ribosomal peptide synthetase component F